MTDQTSDPSPPPPTGTIDITDFMLKMKDTWVRTSVDFIYQTSSSTQYTFWLRWPVISTIYKTILELIFKALGNATYMEAFFINTALRKASQAQDYVDANNALKALPPSASYQEYYNAEQTEMVAFRNFVMVSN